MEVVFRSTVSTDRTVADILAGVADVGFASKPVYSATLQVTELFEDELLLAVSPAHRLAGVELATVKDIRTERLILFERGASIRRASDQFFARAGIKPDLALESNDTDFIKLMVKSGVGISLLPAWAIREEVRTARWCRCGSRGTGSGARSPCSPADAPSRRRRGRSSRSSRAGRRVAAGGQAVAEEV